MKQDPTKSIILIVIFIFCKGLERESLIDFALLVGSDYTVGVENVGIVKAVEILNEFEGNGIEKLKNFKEWHTTAKGSKQKMSKIRQTLSKLELAESFPSEIVFNAYINPDVDKSKEEFAWSMPDLDSLRKFLINKMAWTVKKIDDDLLPIIKRLNEKNIQKTIENFFTYEKISSFSKQSKRMKKAISLFKSKSDVVDTNNDDLNLSENDDSDDVVVENSTRNQTKKTIKPKKNKNSDKEPDVILVDSDEEKTSPNKRKSSDSLLPKNAKKPTRSSTRRAKKK